MVSGRSLVALWWRLLLVFCTGVSFLCRDLTRGSRLVMVVVAALWLPCGGFYYWRVLVFSLCGYRSPCLPLICLKNTPQGEGNAALLYPGKGTEVALLTAMGREVRPTRPASLRNATPLSECRLSGGIISLPRGIKAARRKQTRVYI